MIIERQAGVFFGIEFDEGDVLKTPAATIYYY